MPEISSEETLIWPMTSVMRSIALFPWSTACFASFDNSLAFNAFIEFCLVTEEISSIEAEVSSIEAAWPQLNGQHLQ